MKLYVTIFLTILSVSVAFAQERSEVLVLNPHRENLPLNDHIIKSIVRSIADDHRHTYVVSDNMNILTISTPAQLDSLTHQLLEGYTRPPQVVVMESNTVWALMHEAVEQKWGDIPIVWCYTSDWVGPRECYLQKTAFTRENRISVEDAAKGKNVALVPAKHFLRETIDMMDEVLPALDTLVFISDTRQINAQHRAEITHIAQSERPALTVKFFTNDTYTLEEVIDSLDTFGPRTGVLFSSWYTSPPNDRKQTWGHRIIAQHSGHPIFNLADASVRESGLAGGYLYRFEEIGRAVADDVLRVLDGTPARDLRYPDIKPSCVVNYPTARQFSLDMGKLPANTVFYNRPYSLWELHKWEIVIGMILLLSISVIFYIRLQMIVRVRRTQERELKTIQRYDRMFNGMPIAFSSISVTKNRRGEVVGYVITKWNTAYEKYFYKPASDKAIPMNTFWPAGDPRMDIPLWEMTQTVQSGETKQFRYLHRDTGRIYNKVFIPSSDAMHIDAYYMDTTDLAEAQEVITMMCQKMIISLRMTNLVSWEWVLDKDAVECDGYYDSESPDALTPFVLTAEQFYGKIDPDHFRELKPKFHTLLKGELKVLNISFRAHHVFDDNNSHYEWVETSAVVHRRDARGRPLSIVGSSLYVTKYKELEEQLIAAKEQAEESNRLKSAFLANMSHEIRTPLNAIVGFSEILATVTTEEERSEYIKIIKNNNKLLLQLINDILDLSKIEAGMLEFDYTPVDVGSLMQEVYQSTLLKTQNGNVEIVLEQGESGCMIRTDRNRMLQVINNFISNAVKFTPAGSIRIGYGCSGDNFRFYVADTGMGVAEELQEQIFERFVKLNDFIQGTGLGLPICKTIVETMGGEIGVESKAGKGSTFWFTIPHDDAQNEKSV